MALQLFGAFGAAQTIEQAGQRREVLEPERGSTGRGRDEHIRLDRVGPAHRKRILAAGRSKEANTLLNGPVVKSDALANVATTQRQVDDLLGSLGF